MAREYEGIANALASRGRGGDSMMIHVSPMEVEYLESIAPSLGINLPGGKLPINPYTGQPEAFPFLFALLGAIPAALSAGVGAIGTGATLGSIGTAMGTAATTTLLPFTGMFTGGLTGIAEGILGSTLTGALGLGGGGGGTAGATAAGGALSGEALGSALGTGEIIAQNAPALAEAASLGGEVGGELVATLPEVAGGGLEGAFEALPSMLPESVGTLGETGSSGLYGGSTPLSEAGPGLGVDTGYTVADAAEFAADPLAEVGGPYYQGSLGAQAGPDLAQHLPTFMDKVQSGLKAFGNDPWGQTMKGIGKGAEAALNRPVETAAGITALNAIMPEDGGGEENGDRGSTWASQQEGEGDPFTYAETGTGGGEMISQAPADYIADSPVSMSPSAEMLSGMPGAKGNMLARRGGVMDEGIGMMPVGPDMAAPVGIAEREIPGQEEALEMFQEGDFGPDMTIEEMMANMPPGMTMEDMEELLLMLGPDAMGGMV